MSEEKKYQVLYSGSEKGWQIFPEEIFTNHNPTFHNYWDAWALYVKICDKSWGDGAAFINKWRLHPRTSDKTNDGLPGDTNV